MHRVLGLATLLLSPACFPREIADDEGRPDEQGGARFTPESGTYRLEPGEERTDCPDDDTTYQASLIEVAVDAGTTTFSWDDGGGELVCPMSGDAFSCEGAEGEIDYAAYGFDALVTYASGFGGAWTSARTFTGSSDLDMACEGRDCALVQELGGWCSSSVAFTGEKVE